MVACLQNPQFTEPTRLGPRTAGRRRGDLSGGANGTQSRNGAADGVYRLLVPSSPSQRAPETPKADGRNKQAEPCVDLAIGTPAGANSRAADCAEAERRFRIIEPLVRPELFQQLWERHKGRKGKLVESIAASNQLSRRTVYSWLRAWSKGGMHGLVRSDRSDKGAPRSLNTAAIEFIVAAMLPKPGAYGELSVREVFRAYQEERAWRAACASRQLEKGEGKKYERYLGQDGCLEPTAQLPEASYETFRRWAARIPKPVKDYARKGPQEYYNNCEMLSYRDIESLKPLDFLVLDHRMLDLFCLVRAREGGWKLVRPYLTAAIDFRTRKWVSWAVVEIPSSDSIASVLKQAFVKFGVPRAIYADNGRDFKAQWLAGGRKHASISQRSLELGGSMQGVLAMLGVRVIHAIVRRARSKVIEPCFRATAEFDRSLPEYTGHKPSARPERLVQMIKAHQQWEKRDRQDTPFRTIEQVSWLYGEFLSTLNDRPHEGCGMQKLSPNGLAWMTPNKVWAKLIAGVEQRTIDAETLRFCFTKRREVTVRHGEVCTRFGGRDYHYRMIDAQTLLVGLSGRRVEVHFDPFDLETVAIYSENRFLGIAANAELRKMNEASFVEDERNRRVVRRGIRNAIRAVHANIPMATAEERAARRMASRPAELIAEGIKTPMPLPPAIVEAVEAQRKTGAFSFRDAGEILACNSAPVPAASDDDEFIFFAEAR